MKNFEGKIAFITGGASGVGLGQAKVFSKAGMKVVITDIRREAIAKAVPEILAYSGADPSSILALGFDLTDRETFGQAADKCEEVFGGPPHLLIQTAGVNAFGPAEASTFGDFDWVMGVCLNAVVNGLVLIVPRMVKAYGGKAECHIVTTSSWGGWSGGALTAPYSAAKAAVNSLMESYHISLKPYGFGATALCPMAVDSGIYDAEKYRPAEFEDSGYHWTDGTAGLMREYCESGMDPVVLAEHLKRGIENDQVYVVPYDNAYEMIARVQERQRNFASPEGMLKEAAAEAYKPERDIGAPDAAILREKGPPLGFGKARKGLDWVHESHKV